MTTKIKILSVVFLNIRLFRLPFVPLLAGESACFPVTFLSLLFWIFFANRQNKSRSVHQLGIVRRAKLMGDRLCNPI